jgi:hypothetical protein
MRRFVLEAAALLALFAAVTGLASLLGAENLGTAAAFGQIAFVAGLVYVLLRR